MLQPGLATLAVATHLLHVRLANSLGREIVNCLLYTLHDELLQLVQKASCWLSAVAAAVLFLLYRVKHFCLSRFGFGIMWVAILMGMPHRLIIRLTQRPLQCQS